MTNVELEITLREISHLVHLIRYNSTNEQQKEFGFEYESIMKQDESGNTKFDDTIKFTLPADE